MSKKIVFFMLFLFFLFTFFFFVQFLSLAFKHNCDWWSKLIEVLQPSSMVTCDIITISVFLSQTLVYFIHSNSTFFSCLLQCYPYFVSEPVILVRFKWNRVQQFPQSSKCIIENVYNNCFFSIAKCIACQIGCKLKWKLLGKWESINVNLTD